MSLIQAPLPRMTQFMGRREYVPSIPKLNTNSVPWTIGHACTHARSSTRSMLFNGYLIADDHWSVHARKKEENWVSDGRIAARVRPRG